MKKAYPVDWFPTTDLNQQKEYAMIDFNPNISGQPQQTFNDPLTDLLR